MRIVSCARYASRSRLWTISRVHLGQRASSSLAASTSYNLASPINEYIRVAEPNTRIDAKSDDLVIYPGFLDQREQSILLTAALRKLESVSGREERKKRRDYRKKHKLAAIPDVNDLQDFLPDEVYDFQDRHFDGVISGYRETTLTSWPSMSALAGVLDKIYSLIPPSSVSIPSNALNSTADELASPSHLITHLLHLSSQGYILPHVDNIQASAGTIVGICLGSTRELVLRQQVTGEEGNQGQHSNEIRLRLDPGCAYLQRGKIRYAWEHQIPLPLEEEDRGQRLSVMIRDRLQRE